ncbi:MAG: potassium-transporting ATPase subunit KdpC [Chitinophagaceae bacterium]|nr:potassium-transporting ATPase subunit KdpC [Chitinophagaceae bacterium]
MKANIFIALRLTAVSLLLCAGIYTLLIRACAQLAPNKGKGMMCTQKGQSYYSNIGQAFTEDRYFNSRPSAVGYNAAGSGGSNKGSNNPGYRAQVQERIDRFMAHNPGIPKSKIPVDLVTASGSGLDPDISEAAASVQVKRIAAVRSIDEAVLQQLVEQHTEKPLLGLFGPSRINVLELNIALDNISK